MSKIKFSNEPGGSMIDVLTGKPVSWLSKNRVRLTEEGQNAVELANMLVHMAKEIVEWAGRLDSIDDHDDLEPYFRLSVSIGQPRPDMKPTSNSSGMSSMDLDDDGENEEEA